MQCYTELIAPSAVTHAASLSFLHAKANNLVVAKTSLLQIYSLKTNGKGLPETNISSKLVLIAEYPLSGNVTSLAPVKALNTKSGGDALLIAFKDAKLSLVEWDPDNYKVSTVSIHYYEGENVSGQPFGPSLSQSQSILTVDPSSRCAALKFGARCLAILPFQQLGDELGEVGDDEYDAEIDAPPSATIKRSQPALNETVDSDAKQTPYKASFVLPLTALDPALTHPVDLKFLHEYREPTFGILSAPTQPSSALLEERKDILSYTVFTLDLEQRASTNLISVQKLPSDLWKVVPLPLPVGGALLVGLNEFVHVDQSGRTNAVAVNAFGEVVTSFGMTDQSDLNMKLENCEIESLDPKTGDLLVLSDDGSLAVLSFRLLGRNIGGLTVTPVPAGNGGALLGAAPSCIASSAGNTMFVGSEDGDSTLLSWSKPTSVLSRKRSHAQMLGQDAAADEEEGEEDLDEDDLYATVPEVTKRTSSFSSPRTTDAASSYQFDIHDTLPSLGPINNVCFGRSPSMPADKLEFVAATGRRKASRLAFMGKEIVPSVLQSLTLENAQNAWSLCARSKDIQQQPPHDIVDHDNMFFVYDGDGTKAYDVTGNSEENMAAYTERTGTEFEREGETLAVSTLAQGTRVVQCRRSEIRTYDAADLALSQIIPMMDEETDAELRIVHVSFSDPYVLVLRDDNSILVLRVDESGDIEPLESEGATKERKWLSGCLYSGELTANDTAMFLLSSDGGLHIFSLPNCESTYTIPMLSHLPAVLSPDLPQRRVGAKESLTEILFADLGKEDTKQPFLILRSALDDLILYEPWGSNSGSWSDNLRFRKVPLTYIPKFDELVAEENDSRPAPLRSITLGGRSTIYVPGSVPSLIVKESISQPKVLDLRAKHIRAITPLHHKVCEHGFGLIDSTGNLQSRQLPPDVDFNTGWCVKKVALGDPAQEIRHVAFHDQRQIYVVATCRDVEFYFSEENGRHQEQDGKSNTFPILLQRKHHEHIRPLLEISVERRL